MPVDQIAGFSAKAKAEPELAEQLKSCLKMKELFALSREHGFHFTEDDLYPPNEPQFTEDQLSERMRQALFHPLVLRFSFVIPRFVELANKSRDPSFPDPLNWIPRSSRGMTGPGGFVVFRLQASGFQCLFCADRCLNTHQVKPVGIDDFQVLFRAVAFFFMRGTK